MKAQKVVAGLALSLAVLSAALISGKGQEEDQSKSIKAEEFISKRPKATARNTSPARKPTYRAAELGVAAVPPAGKVFAQVGMTIWRFRPATSEDKTKELVEEEDTGRTEVSLERISEGTILTPGQKVRLGIESLSRDGFLYVINREQYADGSVGDARLIYPTKRTPIGGNHVKAGKIVYIPSAPRYFRIKPSQTSKGHVAELISVFVSPVSLVDGAKLSNTPMVIDRIELESWEKKWGAQVTKFEMEGGAGQTMTDKEQAAGLKETQLTQDEPVPQTIYRVAIRPDDALMVTVPLRFVPPKP